MAISCLNGNSINAEIIKGRGRIIVAIVHLKAAVFSFSLRDVNTADKKNRNNIDPIKKEITNIVSIVREVFHSKLTILFNHLN